jgi:hypothetical protein
VERLRGKEEKEFVSGVMLNGTKLKDTDVYLEYERVVN